MKNTIGRRKAVLCAEVSKTATRGFSVIKSSLAWASLFYSGSRSLWSVIYDVEYQRPQCSWWVMFPAAFPSPFIFPPSVFYSYFFSPTSFKKLRDVLGNTLKISHVNMRELYIRNEGYLANYVLHFKILKSGKKTQKGSNCNLKQIFLNTDTENRIR